MESVWVWFWGDLEFGLVVFWGVWGFCCYAVRVCSRSDLTIFVWCRVTLFDCFGFCAVDLVWF